MSCYSTTCTCSRCREGMPESGRRVSKYKDNILVATNTTALSKQEKLKALMKEFPERTVEDLMKVLEVGE